MNVNDFKALHELSKSARAKMKIEFTVEELIAFIEGLSIGVAKPASAAVPVAAKTKPAASPAPAEPQYLDPKGVMALLKVSYNTLYNWAKKGKLVPEKKIGNKLAYNRLTVEALMRGSQKTVIATADTADAPQKDEYYSPKEVMELFKVTYNTLFNWKKKGKLVPEQISPRRFVYKKSYIDEIVAKGFKKDRKARKGTGKKRGRKPTKAIQAPVVPVKEKPDPDKHLNTQSVMEILKVNYDTLLDWRKSGKLIPKKFGIRKFYDKDEVNKILAENPA
jgi:predicted site-specific integrase-resolvase